jgi:hypothetical protein
MPIGFRRHTRRQAHRAVLLTAAAGLVLGGVAAGPAQAAPAGPAPAVPAPVAAPKVATPEVTAGLVAERSGLSREQTKQRLAAEAKRIAPAPAGPTSSAAAGSWSP